MTIAVYPGSFDPVTNGHLDIAARAAAIFDRLIVAVYDAPAKNVLFSTEERVALFSEAVAGLDNVTVTSFSGLTVDYAASANAKVLVRGLRAISDFELEMQMALLNRKMSPALEVVCLMTSLQYSFLSSSIIKEIASLGGCIDGLVPQHVAKELNRKYEKLRAAAPIPRYLSS
ncbi:MAG: pantetheine-phosphate adenylyltransferase [Chloroflexi bacterium]|nr:pantetheine-phosphate adenylyltransferase [Chloroflexota bacterium]